MAMGTSAGNDLYRDQDAERLVAAALAVAATGVPIFPVALINGNKRPLVRDWGSAATTDPAVIRRWFSWPKAKLIGVPTGPRTNIDVLDFDPRHGSDEWRARHIDRLPETRIHGTMSGGEHWLFGHVDGVRNQQNGKAIAPGIDVRGTGGFVIWPPSPGYSIIHEAKIADWPVWLLPLVVKPDKPPPQRPTAPPTVRPDQFGRRYQGLVGALLDNVRAAAEGSKHDTLLKNARAIGGVMDAAGISEADALAWLLQALPDTVQCWDAAKDTALDGLRHGRNAPIELEDRPYRGNGKGHAEAAPPPSPTESESEPQKKKRQSVNALAIVNFIANHPQWRPALRVNLFTEQLQVAEPFPPADGDPAEQLTYRPFSEPGDLLEAMLWFQGAGFPKAGKNLVWDALAASAYRCAFHPVRTYLSSLAWDGVERLGGLFRHYFEASIPDDSQEADRTVAYLEHISLCFAVSAVARIRQPGCKVDHVPVLVGNQGWNKSQAIRALCHDATWFSDDLPPDLAERDTKESLLGKWLIELAEIPHVRKEVNQVKAFFARQTDRYRRAYDRRTGDWPRQCVFVGTANDVEFIDGTGNRRFWPVEIAGPIDVARIVSDRNQLWAEAVALYERGLRWWLAPKIEALAAEQQSRFEEEDVWSGPLSAWLAVRTSPFTLTDAMVGALEFLNAKHITKPDQMRASACLKSLGYRRRKTRVGGKIEPLWHRQR